MSEKKKKVTFLRVLKIILKRTKLSTLLLLAITFASSSFAWFVYATKVSSGVTAHVRAWNVMFTAKDNQIEEFVEFTIPIIEPGMDDYSDSITAYNKGEHVATVTYEIVSAEILGVTYGVDGTTLTSDMLENKLASDFPFKITMGISNEYMDPENGMSTFSIYVSWPYESGNDEVDTYWGMKSYEYTTNNPEEDSIKLNIKISAIQPDA
jgi:hypothetical protein